MFNQTLRRVNYIIFSFLFFLSTTRNAAGVKPPPPPVPPGPEGLVVGMAMDLISAALLRDIKNVDKEQSNVYITSEAQSDLLKAKKVAVVFIAPEMRRTSLSIFGDGNLCVLEDSLAGLLLQMNYDVIPPEAFYASATTTLSNETQEIMQNRLEIAKKLGADLLIGGSAVFSTVHNMNLGVFGGRSESRMKSVIENATVRIINCQDNKLVLVGTVVYKKGKSAPNVASDLATIIQKVREGITSVDTKRSKQK